MDTASEGIDLPVESLPTQPIDMRELLRAGLDRDA